jgi:hypothetical protein
MLMRITIGIGDGPNVQGLFLPILHEKEGVSAAMPGAHPR